MYKINDTQDRILAQLIQDHPEIKKVLKRARNNVPFLRQQVIEYQGALLYAVAKKYNGAESLFLEIGTAWGYSATCLAEGAPDAKIHTLNPHPKEVIKAREHLSPYKNVTVIPELSWDYYETAVDSQLSFDLIFVDGDHKRVKKDLKWWKLLNTGGMMLFHDYAPIDSGRPCPPVYDALNEWGKELGRPFDLSVIDDQQIGMVGIIKRDDNV